MFRPSTGTLRGAIAAVICLAIFQPAAAQDASPSVNEIVEAWMASAHGDRSAEAFVHWNEDGEVPGTCAVCHSSLGFADYVGGTMSTVGQIDHPVALGTTVDCATCHSDAASNLAAVPFLSGVTVSTPTGSAVCTVCHQGRAWTGSVDAAVADLDDDTVSADLGFVNTHYAMAAATQQGTLVKSGYEYEGKTYAGPFAHVPGLETCASCHQPHSLTVALDNCTSCHRDVTEFRQIRTSPQDFDGDGNATEGIADPIATLHTQLGAAIALYARDAAGSPVIYAADAYPYFFNDTDADGAVTEGEAAFPNRYQSWTPRLLRAAYNYQYVAKDKGAFAHNPHYALQLLYDSLESLSQKVEVDMSTLTRP